VKSEPADMPAPAATSAVRVPRYPRRPNISVAAAAIDSSRSLAGSLGTTQF
jgi:hypothetical protein